MSIYALKPTLADLTSQNTIDSGDLVARVAEIEGDLEAIDEDRENGVVDA